MGNDTSKIEQKEKTALVAEPDDHLPSRSKATQQTSTPQTYGTVGQAGHDPHDEHGIPHVPPVEGLGFCQRILISFSHRTTVLFVGAALGILFLGLDSKFNRRLDHHPQTSRATMIIVTVTSYLACALLITGGIFGCLRAHKITWWKVLAPGLVLQIALLIYYVYTFHTSVIDEFTFDMHAPDNLTDVDSDADVP